MPSESLSPTKTSDSLRAYLRRYDKLVRIALFAWVLLIACPIRYCRLDSGNGIDATWRFALNYAAAQGSAVASKIIFTMGPLGYLTFPENVGNNLMHGLFLQAGLWLILAAIFADIFFRSRFPLRNLALFSFCFSLAVPLFWFEFVGTEYLLLAGALMLFIMFRLRGSWIRLLAALVLVGLLPFLKTSAAVMGIAASMGFLIDRAIQHRWKALPEVALIVLVPTAVTTAGFLCIMPSFRSFLYYLRGMVDIVGGYSAGMSRAGPTIELISAAIAVVLLMLFLWRVASDPSVGRFYVLLLAIPLFASLKQGFVLQNEHIINYFCFVALVLALLSLGINLDTVGARRVATFVILMFFVVWLYNVGSWGIVAKMPWRTSHQDRWSGKQSARLLWGALRFHKLKRRLDSSIDEFPEDSRIEPELVKVIGDSPVASLSDNFTNLAAARLRLQLYPVVQRYSAYTPYLDGLNAAWIRNDGPKFLVFDGQGFDDRHPWTETPAMWLEVYRWYDARLLGPRNLLLERRAEPRFKTLETVGRFRVAFPGELRLPVSNHAVFWTMKCEYSTTGRLLKLMLRPPRVLMSVHEANGSTRSGYDVIPGVLVSPVLGNYLPSSLSQFYAVFQPGLERDYFIHQVVFETSKSWAYSPACEVEILRPAQ